MTPHEQATGQHAALRLWDAGYGGALLPIIPPNAQLAEKTRITPEKRGKQPGKLGLDGSWFGFKDWPIHQTTRADVEEWVRWGGGFGLRTRDYPFIDIDVDDITTADAVLAAVQKCFGGKLPRRYGRAPRVAVPFRTDAPFRKIILHLRDSSGTSRGAVEVSGDGNQVVIAGTHPKTGNPYSWADGDRTGGAELLAAYKPSSLALLTEPIVRGPLKDALVAALTPLGLTIHELKTVSGNAATVDQAILRAPSLGELRDLVGRIPNGDEFSDRGAFIGMLAAIRAAAGPEFEGDGLSIAIEWGERWTGGLNSQSTIRQEYESLAPPHRVGWDYLIGKARANGVDTAASDFDAIGEATPADPQVATDATWSLTASEVERIAAIQQRPERAFFLALPALSESDDVWACLESLRRAAARRDPLHEFFQHTVLLKAYGLRSSIGDPAVFSALLAAQLRAEFKAHDPSAVALLTRAAWALLAPTTMLTGQLSASPGPLLKPGKTGRKWLVDRWIPLPSVAGIIGAPGKGKSFSVLELCGRVSKEPSPDALTGDPVAEEFAGRSVEHGSVLYCGSEDVHGWRERAANWESVYGSATHLRIAEGVPPLSQPAEALSFVRAAAEQMQAAGLPALVLVVIDVFRSAFTGKENDSDDVGAAMATAHAISRMLRASVVLVHHTPRADEQRPRGSNAFEASLDFMAAITKPEHSDVITLEVTRNKSGIAGDRFRWKIGDGVLREHQQPSASDAGLTSITVRCAHAVAVLIGEVASSAKGADASAIRAKLPERFPDLFGPNCGVKNPRSRIADAIKAAEKRDWITTRSDGAYAPGAIPIDTDVAALAAAGGEG